MIRMMVVDMLEDLGFTIAGEAASVSEGVRLAQSADYDVALLDVNLNGEIVEPVARAVAERQRPFLFVSGYGTAGLPDSFRDNAALQKPFKMDALAAALDRAMKM